MSNGANQPSLNFANPNLRNRPEGSRWNVQEQMLQSMNNLMGQGQGSPQQPTGFQIDSSQVQNDIALGSGWGMPTMSPMMNPFSMYGAQQSPFSYSGHLGNFGGK